MTIRSNTAKAAGIALLAAGVAVALALLLFPSQGTGASTATNGPLIRLAAQFNMWNGDEFSTNSLPDVNGTGGQVIWERLVFPPADANVMYVTFSGTGDVHTSTRLEMACVVNTHPCNPGEGNANDDSGWTTLMNVGANDWHDNNVYYTWCMPIPTGGGAKHVQVKMASSSGGTAFLETAYFFIDAQQLSGHVCDQAATPEGAGGGDTPTGNNPGAGASGAGSSGGHS
jgi:hypothetical protein